MHQALADEGAVPRFVGIKLGQAQSVRGDPIEVEISMETAPSAVWDALIVPHGETHAETLAANGHALEFLKDQYRHCKPILVMGAAAGLLDKAGIPQALPSGEPDTGLLRFGGEETGTALPAFIDALAKHRHFARETDPPVV